MDINWELFESGPANADRTVLLLPGGLNRARSYEEVMAEPPLAGVRLVAATLPGHAGTPVPNDCSIEYAAREAARLAADINCDVVVGFSMGATVAFEMISSGAFSGPAVLLGISLSPRDEAMFFRLLDKLAVVIRDVPYAAMRQMMGPLVKRARVPDARRAELLDDLRKTDPKVMRRLFHEYLQYLGRCQAPAKQLCDATAPVWVVHTEKGDGGLTDDERRTLQACANVDVITIPGASYLLPNEEPARIARVVADALGRVDAGQE